ncbi:hypothetical protein MUG87_17010 [Ectobacillus sp. JY-23]|uniref:flagellar motor protein MotB n=1 Tax=Ectobacillus sp. JY-23 TaxID=2933872 RepID=UPI001FF249D4|nr:flagellar motor protein MotB [Ectobacillus sp. JY-23]UOY92116.1 hypothetical protein MUG87_17010 [Ectobacillus sp. JY-23]
MAKKQQHDEHMDESWLIPYADLLTLLLALFIVLFAMSTMDAKKYEKMSQSFNTIFDGGSGNQNFQNPVPTTNGTELPDEVLENNKYYKLYDNIRSQVVEQTETQQADGYINDKQLGERCLSR